MRKQPVFGSTEVLLSLRVKWGITNYDENNTRIHYINNANNEYKGFHTEGSNSLRCLIYKLNIPQQKITCVSQLPSDGMEAIPALGACIPWSLYGQLYLHCRGLLWIQAGSHTGQWCGGRGHCCARTGGRSGCSGGRRTPASRLEPEGTNGHCCCPAISHPAGHLLLAWGWLCFPTPLVVVVVCAAQRFALPKQHLLPLLKYLA